MASAQPLSAFALVESALLPLSGDGSILNRCLEYVGDTPTIIMTLLDGDADYASDADAGDDGATATATTGSIWSHVVSFMDAFTLASLDMTCRHAYRADGWKTADRWVEWDSAQFESARWVEWDSAQFESARIAGSTVEDKKSICFTNYVKYTNRFSFADGFPRAFERDGKSRYRVLGCAVFHLLFESEDETHGPVTVRGPPSYTSEGCGCPIHTAIGKKSGWGRIPVRHKYSLLPTEY